MFYPNIKCGSHYRIRLASDLCTVELVGRLTQLVMII